MSSRCPVVASVVSFLFRERVHVAFIARSVGLFVTATLGLVRRPVFTNVLPCARQVACTCAGFPHPDAMFFMYIIPSSASVQQSGPLRELEILQCIAPHVNLNECVGIGCAVRCKCI